MQSQIILSVAGKFDAVKITNTIDSVIKSLGVKHYSIHCFRPNVEVNVVTNISQEEIIKEINSALVQISLAVNYASYM